LKNLKISFKNTKGGRKIVRTALQEMIVPQLNRIKKESELKFKSFII